MGNLDIAGYASLGSDINKQSTDDREENKLGVVSGKLPELTLDLSNDEIGKLTDKWEREWKESTVKTEWEKHGDENEKYWLGKHFDLPELAYDPNKSDRPNVDNAIFEALETWLPQVTRRNPEPLVELHSSAYDEQGNAPEAYFKYVQKVKNRLGDLADDNVLRLKLKTTGRHWAIRLLGALKFGWDLDRDIPMVVALRPQKLILDPKGTIDEGGRYTGKFVGEYRTLSASRILDTIGDEKKAPDAIKKIKELVKDDLGTDVQFIEWWTKEYMCWTLDKTVLLKSKNLHWNYDRTENAEQVDTYGNATAALQEVKGINHFSSPEIPYRLLSIFNLGEQPVDKTSLIGQNLANQDRINKRNKQIDKNADSMNSGMVVSLVRSGLTATQAKGVTAALARGGSVVIPDGAPRDAVDRYPAPGLPPDLYNDLLDSRNRLRDIFGTRGSSGGGLESERTVRGKILSRTLDTDRIGGGISEYLEQMADGAYNWFVQLLYVYDTGFQFVQGATPPKITISIKEGSLLPKDTLTLANQALELASINKISTIDLYKRLEFPNPEEMAANLWLETNAPHILFRDNPLIQQAFADQAAQAQAQAQTDIEKGETDQDRKLETEIVKGAVKNNQQEGGRSLLSAVPQEGVLPQT